MADQPDHTGSCMIALYPPADVAADLAIDGGLDPSGIHLTIAYTGDAADVDADALAAVAETLATRPPIEATVSGHARFTAGDDGDVIVALLDSPDLDQLRRDAEAALADAGIDLPSTHGFTAHMTLGYIGADDPDPVGRLAAVPVDFDEVTAAHGKTRTSYPLTDLATAAAEAYVTGVLLSGGPVTERVHAGCVAAIHTALEHAGDPDVLEVTLQLGKLEGTWAKVYDRRETLIGAHVAKIEAIWRKACADLDIPKLVRSFRQDAGLTREASTPGWQQTLRAEAKAAAAGMLRGITFGSQADDLADAILLAIALGAAEGKTAALAVAADETGHSGGFDWDKAFAHMYEPLERLEQLPGMADEWVEALIAGNAGDIGSALAKLASDGGTYDDMVTAVEELTTGDNIRAVRTLIDYAMSGSANQGALNRYASEGIEGYDVLTAGDERVCAYCEEQEQANPHTLQPGGTPVVPGHPGCRCAVSPSSRSLPFAAFSQFLTAVT